MYVYCINGFNMLIIVSIVLTHVNHCGMRFYTARKNIFYAFDRDILPK